MADGKHSLAARLWQNRYLLILFTPGFLYFIIFCYVPMGGIVVAFQNYSPFLGFLHSPWVGMQNFISFFTSTYIWRIVRNTLLLNLYGMAVGFTVPIVFALFLNELRSNAYRRVVQTITYFPYFLSWPIVAGLVVQMLSPTGVINHLLHGLFGIEPIYFLIKPQFFRGIFVAANLWKGIGFSAVLYLAAMAGIDPSLYESAVIDGANRLQRTLHITVPGLMPTIAILFILNLGSLLSVGIEPVLLLYNPLTYETADVIGTFVYRRGLAGAGAPPDFGLGAAVGLAQSVVGFVLIVTANSVTKRISEYHLW